MALTDNGNEMVMPVQPMWGGYGNGGFGNGFGGDWGSLIVLFLIAAMFGGFGGGFGGFGGNQLGYDFPWLLNGQAGINANTNNGFDNLAVGNQLSAIQSTLANNEVANCNRVIDNLQTSYGNQIAGLERSFNAQTAIDNRLDSIASDLQKCCCDNELRTEQLRFTVATENASDREAISNGIRDIITNQTASTQAILDKLCQQELDAERRENQNLRTQLNMANLSASQTAQTARLLADNASQTQALEQYLNPAPIPAYVVQNPNCCGNNGCGCGNF